VEIALANEANVADFNGSITSPWARFPKGVAISRILHRELFTVDIVVHQERRERRTEKERKGTTGATIAAKYSHASRPRY
jgi:hypothetical protein